MRPARSAERRRPQRSRTTDVLGVLLDNGTIDLAMYEAGRAFQALFHQAQIDPLRAPSLLRLPGGGGHEPGLPGRARDRLARLLDRLGGLDSPTGRCAWAILGEARSLRDWALREGWSGRPIRAEAAQGILVAALGLLVCRSHGTDQERLTVPDACST